MYYVWFAACHFISQLSYSSKKYTFEVRKCAMRKDNQYVGLPYMCKVLPWTRHNLTIFPDGRDRPKPNTNLATDSRDTSISGAGLMISCYIPSCSYYRLLVFGGKCSSKAQIIDELFEARKDFIDYFCPRKSQVLIQTANIKTWNKWLS